MSEITYCAECDNCLRENKSDAPWRWLCLKHKRAEGFGFVLRNHWVNFAPYLRCADVNGGFCELFEPRKDTTNASEPVSE